MALKKCDQQETALGTTALSLTAAADESIMVRGVYSFGASTTYATISIGQRTVGYYRVAGNLGNQLNFPAGFSDNGPVPPGNLLDLMYARGWHRGFPVGPGQTISVAGPNAAASVNTILYDIYDPGDIKTNQPNGTESAELDYVVYGNAGATIATAVTTEYTNLVNPSTFDAFPFGADVPGNTEITVYGILASTIAPVANDGTNDIATSYLKLTRNQTVLFDKDLNGLILWEALGAQTAVQVGGGPSLIGNYSSTDKRMPFIFPEPMTFKSGEELTVALTTRIATTQDLLVADQVVGLICRSKRS